MAKMDRVGVAAMLATDAELDVCTRCASAFDRDRHELADAIPVDRNERIAGNESLG